MEIKVLYDNRTMKKDVLAGWGFSCLVAGSVLFDTGEDSESLLHNMSEMGVDVSCVKDIVISHDHLDHMGGVEGILKGSKAVKVYGCPGFSGEFKEKVKILQGSLVEPGKIVEIRNNIFVTSPIVGEYKGKGIEEQALVIRTLNGMTIVTGCAHPGIIEIVERVKESFAGEKIYCVLGGFHLKDKTEEEIRKVTERLNELGVEKVGPAHCSGENGIGVFKEKLTEKFIKIEAGKVLEV